MERIWKYELDTTGEQTITVPTRSKPLHVSDQDGNLCVWFLLEQMSEMEELLIRIVGTGHGFSGKEHEYIGTAVMKSGFVWHVFIDHQK